MDLFKIVNTLGNLILQTNFKEGEQEIMIEVKLINLVLGIDELDDAAFPASQYCFRADQNPNGRTASLYTLRQPL